MTGAFSGSPLTVWVGPIRYVFHPGRDVVVGYGSHCDVPLDGPGNPGAPPQPARAVLALRFSGTNWVGIERSPDGVFVEGIRMSTIDVRDGQSITIGDPRRGPRVILGVGPAVPPPAADPPPKPNPHAPTQSTTQRMRIPTSQPRPPAPAPASPPPESQRLIERISTTKLPVVSSPAPQAAEPNTTSRLPLKPGARTVGVAAHWLGLTADGHELLTKVSFTARPGTLTAVVGPSAARNSALLGLLAGANEPTSGTVTVDEHDVHAEPELMRTRIGIVSRDDRTHPNLSVERALVYAAELRLPPDTSSEHRDRVVHQVLDELGLTPHRRTRIGKLALEMRRLASMAIELITRPTLLVVDELSAGLDAAQEQHVLAALRRQAELGCVVVVALTSQTSLTHLNMCDQVLLLTPAGQLAFAGPPARIESAVGTADWSQVIAQVSAGAQQALTAPPPVAEPAPPSLGLTVSQQVRVVARRQFRLLLAKRVSFLVLVVLPFGLAGLTLLIPGHSGLDRAGPTSANPHEAIEILAALNIAAVILGTALTIGDLVGQRGVFLREQSVGLATSAYVSGKLIVFSVVAALQAAVLTAIVIGVKGGPAHGAVLLHNPDVELYVAVAATAIVSAVIGLALSSLGSSLREVLPLVVPAILASLLFAGGLVPLVGTWGFDQISWIVPAQWGFAASGSTVDLHRVDPLATNALTWTHYSGWWVFDMVMLLAFGAMWAGVVLFRLRHRTAATSRPIR
jgi:ABC transport system ATP-binding/permease protein